MDKIEKKQNTGTGGNGPILKVDNLQTHFYTEDGIAKAVDGVSFSVSPGETLGLVGESGSGKSVSVLSVMGLIKDPPGRIVGGTIEFEGTNLLTLSERQMRGIRGRQISMIFQEPMTSLNPVYTIGDQIAEMFQTHQKESRKTSLDRAVEMLNKVKIPSPEKRIKEYPHQLSGGMRQRAMIAMALACSPKILIADEPTTALDVTIQAQILDLMHALKSSHQTAVLMITHDLGVIAQIAQRVAVMYAGKVVEQAPVKQLFEDPLHPYTKGLLQSVPILGQRARTGRQRLTEIVGVVPSLYNLPQGCHFAPRCDRRMPECEKTMPELCPLEDGRSIRCHLY